MSIQRKVGVESKREGQERLKLLIKTNIVMEVEGAALTSERNNNHFDENCKF